MGDKPYRCPVCGQQATYEHNLRTHLKGSTARGGHEMTDNEAAEAVGGSVPRRFRVESAGTTAPRWIATPSDPGVPKGIAPPTSPVALMASIPATWNSVAHQGSYLEELFRLLATDKALPKFQFERRIDAILRVFLPELLSKRFGGDVVVVVPEFPLKKADSNQSTNVDYLLYRKAPSPSDERWLFLELKTDSGSVRSEQLGVYRAAMAKGMRRLVADIEPIAEASTARRKYAVLRSRLDGYSLDRPLELIVLTPRREDISDVDSRTHVLTFQDLADIRVERYAEEWALLCRHVLAPAFGVRVHAV